MKNEKERLVQENTEIATAPKRLNQRLRLRNDVLKKESAYKRQANKKSGTAQDLLRKTLLGHEFRSTHAKPKHSPPVTEKFALGICGNG